MNPLLQNPMTHYVDDIPGRILFLVFEIVVDNGVAGIGFGLWSIWDDHTLIL